MTDYDDSLMPAIDEILTADANSEFMREQKKLFAQLERQRVKQARDQAKKESKEQAKKRGKDQTKKEERDQRPSGSTRGNSLDSSSESNKFFKSKGKRDSPPSVESARSIAMNRKSSTEEELECVFGDSETSNMDSTLDRSKTPGKNGSRSSLGTDLSANSSVKIQLDSSTENEPPAKRTGEPVKQPESQNSTKSIRSSQVLDAEAKQAGRSIDKQTLVETKSAEAKSVEMKSAERGPDKQVAEKAVDGEVTGGEEALKKEEKGKKKAERKMKETVRREEASDRAKLRGEEMRSKENEKSSQSNQNAKKSTDKAKPKETDGAMDQTESGGQLAKARPKRGVEIRSVEPSSSETPQSKRRRTCTLKDDPLRFVKPVNTPILGLRVGLSRRVSVKSSLHPEIYQDLNKA